MSLLALLQAAQAMNQPQGVAMPGQTLQPQTPSYGDLSDPTLRNSRLNFLDILSNPPQMQAPPQPVQPALRTPDAITGLLALIAAMTGKNGQELAGGITQGWTGAKIGKAQQDTQLAQQQNQFQNQQAQQDYASRANVAKAQLGFAEDDESRAYNERARKEQDAALLERTKATQEGLNYRAGLKGDQKKLDQALKAVGLRYNVSREAAIDILYDQGAIDDETYAKIRPQVGKPTTGEIKDTAQTANTEARTKTENALRDKRLRDFDDKHNKNEQWLQQSEETIKKWKAELRIKQQNANTSRMKAGTAAERLEWQKTNKAGVSAIDKKIAALQTKKAGMIAEAETWKGQMGDIPGLIERRTPQANSALAKIQRQIASIDAQIKNLRDLGGTDSISTLRQQAMDAINKYPKQADFIRKQFKADTGEDLGG